MPLRSSFPVNVDDDDDINNTKPAAIEPNDVSLVRDGGTPSATITNDARAPVTLSRNDVAVDESNQSPLFRQYYPLDNTPESPSESVMVHYHATCVSSPKISLENNNDLLSSKKNLINYRINERKNCLNCVIEVEG